MKRLRLTLPVFAFAVRRPPGESLPRTCFREWFPASPPTTNATSLNLLISVDGEEHPIQLDRPMVVNLGNAQRTIIVRQAP